MEDLRIEFIHDKNNVYNKNDLYKILNTYPDLEFEMKDVTIQELDQKRQDEVIRHAIDSYRWSIKNGISEEMARCVLPSMSRLHITGTLRSWLNYADHIHYVHNIHYVMVKDYIFSLINS